VIGEGKPRTQAQPFLLAACGAALLLQTAAAQDTVFITEFIAANSGALLDEDGDAPDWIELYNAGSDTVDLANWHLTDDAANLVKWTFPATNLAAGNHLLVFASGKNRAVAGGPLHTSFQLDSAGEYLALVKPDGATVANEFAPLFPPQVGGVSYGIEVAVAASAFVTDGAPMKWHLPLDSGAMPAGWAATNFADNAWSGGALGLGFSGGISNLFGPGPVTNNVAPGRPATQSSTNGGYGPQLAVNTNLSDFTHTLAGVNLPATWEVNLSSNHGIGAVTLWNRANNRSRLRDITVRIRTADGTATNYTSALLNPENVLGGGGIGAGPANLSLNLTQLTGGLVIGGRIHVTRTPDPDNSGTGGATSTSEPDVLSLAEVEVFAVPMSTTTNGVFAGAFLTDAASAMKNVNATALIRVPFNIPEEELPILDTLTLQMKYDDGFVAHLNGVEIARRNAPASPAWNSVATAGHADAAALVFEDIDVTPFIPLLQEGNNVLAIQALNVAAADSDFLIVPQLTGRKVNLAPDRYFATPTPGAVNGGGALGIVADTKFSVDRGFYDIPFTVAITSATAGAEIRFTTNNEIPGAVSGSLYTSPIPISRTTVLRAIATKPGWLPSDVDTHTYVFISNVLAQTFQTATNAGMPASWTNAAWPGVVADYAMDQTIIATNTGAVASALRALPSIFLSATTSNLFHPANGIYTHPTSHGIVWERPASMELVGTNGETEFSVNCGLRIQGGAFRSFSYSEKKSLRLLFKSDYGPGRLHHDVFDDPDGVQAFDGFVLRAGGNDGYAWSSAGTTVQFTRDEFGRQLQLDMGHPAARGLFVHVYLNGLYWGIYNLVERPNEDFCADHMGGDATVWDSITSKYNLKSGDFAAWSGMTNLMTGLSTYAQYLQVQGNHPDGSRNAAYPVLFDKLDYLDYMLLNIWGGNWDWPDNNYWMARKRTADSTGFKFFAWDYENTLGNNRSRSPLNAVAPRVDGNGNEGKGVGFPHHALKHYSEYRIDFADRVNLHFFNGGLLSPATLTNRYQQLADAFQPALPAESARWGDDNRTPAYGLAEWLGERDWILTNYLPQRTAVVLGQFLANGLYPAVSAPAFNQFGGAVPAEFGLVLTHTNAGGTVFYTLDGSDPRTPGSGAVSPTALAYSTAVTLNSPTQVRARVLHGGTWSARTEAMFHPPQDLSTLALTEVMYHAPNAGTTDGDEFDFVELKNTGTNTLTLSGLIFTAGITFTFTNGTTLASGQFCVLARNAAAMAAKYPGLQPGGIFTGKLDNGGETLTLSHPLGATVFSVSYGDAPPWPVTADGFGFSLVQGGAFSQAPDKGGRWRASAEVGGSPGADDPSPGIAPIVINEILTHTDPPQMDSLELFNPAATNVNIGGWFLTDDAGMPKKYRLPTNSIIPAGGFVSFTEAQFNAAPGSSNSFALSSTGDDVYLFSADAAGDLTGYNHGVRFDAAFNGVSFGRYINSAGEEFFPLQTALSPGTPNADPRIGPVIISEIHYHPDAGGDEFIELLNVTASTVPLFDPLRPTNTWKLTGIGITFPTNILLGAGQPLLLVATNPAVFRAKHGVSNAVPILGPFTGALDNRGENLELQAPDNPNSNSLPHVTVEAVHYNDQSPWPPGADGTGLSLQRTFALSYGNEPLNWTAAAPTPGQSLGSGDTDGDGLPDAWELANGTQANLPDAGADPDADGLTNGQEFLAGTNPLDPADALQIMSVMALPAGINLNFQAASNHTYSVLWKASLSDSWSKLGDVPSAPTNRTVSMTDLAPAGNARFYRLVTPAQP
jgi:hypothetical protein